MSDEANYYVITGRAMAGNHPIMASNPQWAIVGKHGNMRGSRFAAGAKETNRVATMWWEVWDIVEVLPFDSEAGALAFIEEF